MPGYYLVNLETMQLIDSRRYDNEAAAAEFIGGLPAVIVEIERDYETGEAEVKFSPAYSDATFSLRLQTHYYATSTASKRARPEVLAVEVFIAAYAAHVARGGE